MSFLNERESVCVMDWWIILRRSAKLRVELHAR